ncbi:hypothetical protein, partial [Petrotoga sp. 9PW.55.5.1]
MEEFDLKQYTKNILM